MRDADKDQSGLRGSYVLGGLALLFISSACLLAVAKNGELASGAWFLALVMMAITTLAAAVTVFAGLKLAAPGEAFGLPSGSIRALLALGVMILLVVFGLRFIAVDRPAPQFVEQSSVKAEELDSAIKRYEAAGFVVVVIKPGVPKSDPQTTPVENAELKLYRARGPSLADMDLVKQVLTAIMTLLTSVISFYFGARSASEAKEGDAKSPGAAPTELLVSRKTLGDSAKTAEAQVNTLKVTLSELTARPAPSPETDEHKKKREDTAAKAAAEVTQSETLLKTALACLAEFDTAVSLITKATDPEALAQHKTEAEAALREAKAALDDFAPASSGAKALLETLEQLTAAG